MPIRLLRMVLGRHKQLLIRSADQQPPPPPRRLYATHFTDKYVPGTHSTRFSRFFEIFKLNQAPRIGGRNNRLRLKRSADSFSFNAAKWSAPWFRPFIRQKWTLKACDFFLVCPEPADRRSPKKQKQKKASWRVGPSKRINIVRAKKRRKIQVAHWP